MSTATENRYLGICWEPRATIRRIVESDPHAAVIVIVAVSGFAGVIANWASGNPTAFTIGNHGFGAFPTRTWTLTHLLLIGVGPLIAIAMLYVYGALIRWTGGLMGGTGSAIEVRAALAWSAIPSIVVYLILVFTGIIGWTRIVLPDPAEIGAYGRVFWAQFVSPAFLMLGLLSLWSYVIRLKCIGEVHRFSAWKALSAYAIAGVVVTGVVFLASLSIGLLVGSMLRGR